MQNYGRMFLEGFCRIGRTEVRSAASHRSARLAKKHFVASPTVSAVSTRNPDFLGLHRATIGLTAEERNAESENTTPTGAEMEFAFRRFLQKSTLPCRLSRFL